MAILIQQLENVVNIIETTAAAGSTIIRALSTSCIAVPKTQEVTETVIQILDDKGKPTFSVNFNASLQVQDKGGTAAPFVGTRDALLDKLNDTYFINFVTTSGGGGGGGDASAANQLTQITELQKLTDSNSPSHQEVVNPAALVISSFKTLSFICKGAIAVTLDGNTIVYPQNLGGGSTLYGSTFYADSSSLNAATFNGTGTVFITIKQ